MRKICLFLLVFSAFGLNAQTQVVPCTITVPATLSEANGDRLEVSVSCAFETFHFQLFNRWGELIYETQTFSTPLNFNYQMKQKVKKKKFVVVKIPSGQYTWKVTVKESSSLNTFEKTGMLTLL